MPPLSSTFILVYKYDICPNEPKTKTEISMLKKVINEILILNISLFHNEFFGVAI